MDIPGKATISNRTSTIASQFARARAPYVTPTEQQKVERCHLLRIDPDAPTCAYCGVAATEWDHLMPMVTGSAWTGYCTEINNLIPACRDCNTSKGGSPFAGWMRRRARNGPAVRLRQRGFDSLEACDLELERRIAIIENAVAACPPHRIDVGVDNLESELEACRHEINAMLAKAEGVAAKLRARYATLMAPA